MLEYTHIKKEREIIMVMTNLFFIFSAIVSAVSNLALFSYEQLHKDFS